MIVSLRPQTIMVRHAKPNVFGYYRVPYPGSGELLLDPPQEATVTTWSVCGLTLVRLNGLDFPQQYRLVWVNLDQLEVQHDKTHQHQ